MYMYTDSIIQMHHMSRFYGSHFTMKVFHNYVANLRTMGNYIICCMDTKSNEKHMQCLPLLKCPRKLFHMMYIAILIQGFVYYR